MDEILKLYTDDILKKEGITREEVEIAIKGIGFTDDDIFKYVFGSDDETSRLIMKSFVTCLLQEKVLNITYKNIEHTKGGLSQKGIRFDLLVEIINDNDETKYINLEMQNYGTAQENEIRSQYYLARMIADQPVGNYNTLNKSYQVMICNRMYSLKKEEDFCNQFVMKHEMKNYEMNNNKLVIIYVELEKLNKLDTSDIHKWTMLEKMGYMIKYSQDSSRYDIIKVLIEESDVLQMMVNKKDDYFKNTSEAIATMRAYFDKQIEDHLEEIAHKNGFEEGIEIGVKQGKEIGIEQGKKEKEQEIIAKLMDNGFSKEEIMKMMK